MACSIDIDRVCPAASGIAGLLWTTLSPSWTFAYLAAWMAIALLALIATDRSATA